MANFLGCSPNAIVAFDFFRAKGLPDFQAAAVAGNLQWESQVDPNLSAPDPTTTNPARMGRGIAMWGDPGRWQSLLAFASAKGMDPFALATQLEFVWFELPSNGLNALRAAGDLDSAVIAFQDQFEHPAKAKAHTDGRIDRANAILECATVRPGTPAPTSKRSQAGLVALAGAAVAAVGFGIYKVLSGREQFPERRREYRPTPARFLPRPRREINYRDRLYRG